LIMKKAQNKTQIPTKIEKYSTILFAFILDQF